MLPAVRAALICERVLTEADGVLSAIRIFSQLELPPGAVLEATLLLVLAHLEPAPPGAHQLLMQLEADDGTRIGEQQFAIEAPGEAGTSFSLVVPFRFEAPVEDRTLWLRFAYDTEAQELTRVPLQLRRAPAAAPTA